MLNRRNILAGFSALALTGLTPAGAQAPVQLTEYEGPDEAAAFNARIAEMSKDRLLLVVYHATWCPHCKVMFRLLDEIKDVAPVSFSVLKLDVEKFKVITTQTEGKGGVPNTRFHRDSQIVPFSYKDPAGQIIEGKTGKMYGRPDDAAELLDILAQMDRLSRMLPAATPALVPK